MDIKAQEPTRWSIDDLCNLAALPKRTVRYYLQMGLIDKPMGEKRGSYYEQRHLSQLLRIRELSDAGVSLDRIRMVLAGDDAPVPATPPAVGSVSVRSHVLIAPGISVVIDPQEAQLSPEALRALIRAFMQTHQQQKIANQETHND